MVSLASWVLSSVVVQDVETDAFLGDMSALVAAVALVSSWVSCVLSAFCTVLHLRGVQVPVSVVASTCEHYA